MKQLRFELWDKDQYEGSGFITIDSIYVTNVIETQMRRAYGGFNNVAIIQMSTGKEYIVCDGARKVTTEIWLNKSISNT